MSDITIDGLPSRGLPNSSTRLSAASSAPHHAPMHRDSQVVVNSALSMAALFVLGGTRILYGVIISRSVDRETFGLIGFLLAITLIGSFFLPAGIGSSISRFIPFERGRGNEAGARAAHRVLSGAGWLAACVISAATYFIARTFLRLDSSQSIEVALLTLAYSLYTTQKAALYGFGKVGYYLRLEFISSGIILGMAVVVAISHVGWYLTPFILGYAVFFVASLIGLRSETRGERGRIDPLTRGEMAGYVLLACAGTLAAAGFLQATQLFAASFATADDVASFTAAVTLVAPVFFAPRALALAMFPAMSAAHGAGDLDAIRRQADGATRSLIAVLTPAFVAGVLLAAEVLALFGGAAYVAGTLVFQLILTGALLAVIQVGSVNALSSGRSWQLRIPVGWAVVGCLCGLAIVAVAGPRWGAIGVAGAYVAGTAIGAAGPIVVVWRRYRMQWMGLFVKAAVCVATALAVAILLPDPPEVAARVGLHLTVALVAFATTFMVFRPDLVLLSRQLRSLAEPSPSATEPNS